ncbi:MAG: permease [Gorillibacterium sp.]|nr:permease [Gorillibacterium sp.]
MKIFLQLNTIFLSMLMEAIPFVLVGVIASGFIQIFVTERWIARVMPKNRLLSTILGCFIGVLFPACECGIVPVTRRLLNKGVPLNAGIAFMLTGPIVNPIVLFSTYIAFGNDWKMVGIRAGMAFAVAFLVSLILSYIYPQAPLRITREQLIGQQLTQVEEQAVKRPHFLKQCNQLLTHATEEFFSVGKFLILGAFIASSIQTFVPTAALLHLGSNPLTSSLVMIGLAFTMSLCSEADAFIASSFRSTFSLGSISAFLVFGPMIDIKNTMMLLSAFRTKFVILLIALVTVFTLVGSLIVGRLLG